MKKVMQKKLYFIEVKFRFFTWAQGSIFLILYSATEGSYACNCYLSSKINMNLKTSFVLEAVLGILAYLRPPSTFVTPTCKVSYCPERRLPRTNNWILQETRPNPIVGFDWIPVGFQHYGSVRGPQ